MRDIEFNQHIIVEYVNFSIHVSGYNNNRPIEVLFKHMVFVVNNLRARMLIDMNIFDIENIDFVISARINYIGNCNITFELIVTPLSRSFIKQKIKLQAPIFILTRLYMVVSIEQIILSIEDNFLFEFVKDCSIALFVFVINSSFHVVLIRNDSNQPVYFSKKF